MAGRRRARVRCGEGEGGEAAGSGGWCGNDRGDWPFRRFRRGVTLRPDYSLSNPASI